MALGRKMHDRGGPVFNHQPIHKRPVADIAANEDMIRISFNGREVTQVPGISKEIEINHPTLMPRNPV